MTMKATTTSAPRANGKFAKQATTRARTYLAGLAETAHQTGAITDGHLINIRVNNHKSRKPSAKAVAAEINRLRAMIARHRAAQTN
jgi:hypothetical protein